MILIGQLKAEREQFNHEYQDLVHRHDRLERECAELREQIRMTPERPPAPPIPPPPPPPPPPLVKIMSRLMPWKSGGQSKYLRSKSMSRIDDIKRRQQQQKVQLNI